MVMSETEEVVTPARWKNGSRGWAASKRAADRDPAGAGSQREQQDRRASRSSRRQRVRQAEEQQGGKSEAVGDQGR